MNVLNFVTMNWDFILLAFAAVMLYRRGEIALLEDMLFNFVTDAEKDIGGGKGELKKSAVITWVYERLPSIVTVIISRRTIEKLLEDVLNRAKKKWAENPRLYEYVYGSFCGAIMNATDTHKK